MPEPAFLVPGFVGMLVDLRLSCFGGYIGSRFDLMIRRTGDK